MIAGIYFCSLRSKRFQSSYCAKVRAEAKKRFLHSPPPPPSFIFFCSCPSFLDELREEALATQAIIFASYFPVKPVNCLTAGSFYPASCVYLPNCVLYDRIANDNISHTCLKMVLSTYFRLSFPRIVFSP